MIEGIEKFGFGNLADISEHIGSKKKEEIEYHYEETYLSNKNYFPNKNKILTERNKQNKIISKIFIFNSYSS